MPLGEVRPPAETAVPSFNGVLLREDQVWENMRLAMVRDGQDQVEIDGNGKPLILVPLSLDSPQGIDLFLIDDKGQLGISMERFIPDIRLMPTEVFTEGEAPVGRDYVVFKDGEYVRYDNESGISTQSKSGKVVIRIDDEGQRTFDGRLSDQDFTIPEGAVLIPISHPEPEELADPPIGPQTIVSNARENERVRKRDGGTLKIIYDGSIESLLMD